MSATIERYTINGAFGSSSIAEPTDFVLHADHLASHAYDQKKERALYLDAHREIKGYAPHFVDGTPEWEFWKACAKSRAKAAGCSE